MAQIVRLVWRLDYEVSYSYLDNRGAALKALKDTIEKFWKVVGDGTVNLSFAGTTDEDGVFRRISLEPTSLNGGIEWRSGTALEGVLRDESFRGTDKVVLAQSFVRISRRL
jgi:hypothetical protein